MWKEVPLRLGEKRMPKAPLVQLSNGEYCVPQHYLTYHHTLQSVEALICDIDYDPRYVVFATQDAGGIYIQVGVVGHDNYHNKPSQSELKLLFGRKWRVESELPTSEIIQSVFLAIKKSREHEIRELFKLSLNNSTTTPFNTHIDLPLMAEFYEEPQCHKAPIVAQSAEQQIENTLSRISYDQSKLCLKHVEQRSNGLWLVDIVLERTAGSCLPETGATTLYLQVPDLSMNTLSRALMQEFLRVSDLHVDEHFSYRGFHRFDPNIDIADIADLSQQSRKHELAAHFAHEFSKTNYEIDQRRIPPIQAGPLAQKNRAIIDYFQMATI
ncbi:hypothetical protein [Colwellia sp. 12G3]|uniref:hypothetical protein n=1 Tax=Colwellia sp. 12G3 TaxID=2058299 RepID=UPI000C3200AC|nr:hypothetical protein [Colwellia sp. 12G3]PKI17847.1 hypothetical protein CXF71_02240 [Colwellia sp. 12G3]